MRVIELWDDDNQWLRMRATVVDFATDNDDVALDGRRLGLLDWTTGWFAGGAGKPEDRNVELLIPKP